MKKLLMVLAFGLTLSTVGLAREGGNFYGGGRGEVIVPSGAPAYAVVDCRREHRREHRHHRRYWW